MDEFESQSHSAWECKYHVVFIAKCRRRVRYEQLRRYLGEVFRKLALQRESRIEEGHLMPGPDEPMALTGHRMVAERSRGRVSDPA